MTFLLRGALVEYSGGTFLGPLPNVVLFQFNPESLTRTIEVPPRPTGTGNRETSQAGEVPLEKISLTAHFSSADQLGDDHPLARAFGIGTYLAALEKMVHPAGRIGDLLKKGLDAIGEAISGGRDEQDAQPIPRQQYPRLLFIWGLSRILPVVIDSMTITEQEYDPMLNPVRAEVSLGLSVITPSPCLEDVIAVGAFEYSNTAKEAQAAANLANPIVDIVDLYRI